MKQKHILLLQAELSLMSKATEHLLFSYKRCKPLINKENLSFDELEHFESLTARFARLSDLIIQKIFRLIEQLDLEMSGTIRDYINRAEKKGLIANAEIFIEIRELRNSIVYQYDPNAILEIFKLVVQYCPPLFDAVERIQQYSKQYDISQV